MTQTAWAILATMMGVVGMIFGFWCGKHPARRVV